MPRPTNAELESLIELLDEEGRDEALAALAKILNRQTERPESNRRARAA